LWLLRFAHSPTNFIFWLGRLIFSVHLYNIYITICLRLCQSYFPSFTTATIQLVRKQFKFSQAVLIYIPRCSVYQQM
jgi:hypothetical protein